jgi:cysteinyl-tRNA synthetase
VLFRLLRHRYGADHVSYVRNITDVDDKINARAAEEYPDLALNEAIRKVTEKTDRQFHEDVAALGCLPPTVEPRATEHIAEMRELIERLVASGNAYVAEDNVLFSVPSMPDYGRLARRSLDEMIAGARVDVAPYKRDPMDFVLWKPSKPGEPSWPSPSGIAAPGRPGWHIECSAMSWKHLGETFDIHGGGIDLVFPHHENEIAQSRSAFHTGVMANYWMHNGFLQVEGEKMSKSLGNFVTIRELLADWPGEVIRLAMLLTHYREPINWTVARLKATGSELWMWASTAHEAASSDFQESMQLNLQELVPDNGVLDALVNDLNTPMAVARLRQLHSLSARGDSDAAQSLLMSMIWLGIYRYAFHTAYDIESIHGGAQAILMRRYEDEILRARALVLNEYRYSADRSTREENVRTLIAKANALNPQMVKDGVEIRINEHCDVTLEPLTDAAKFNADRIESMIAARTAARKSKNFVESDRIRDELAAMGVVLKDSKDGTTWEIAR